MTLKKKYFVTYRLPGIYNFHFDPVIQFSFLFLPLQEVRKS